MSIKIPEHRLRFSHNRSYVRSRSRKLVVCTSLIGFILILSGPPLTYFILQEGVVRPGIRFKQPGVVETAKPLSEIIAQDVREDYQIMALANKEATANLALLKRGFTGEALQLVLREIRTNAQKGQAKIEAMENLEIEVVEISGEERAKVKVEYLDSGYLVDLKTRQALSRPSLTHRVVEVRVVKKEGRWKIASFKD